MYSGINAFCTFHILFPDAFFYAHSNKEPVILLIYKKCITNNCWISISIVLVVLYVPSVIICSVCQRMTGHVVMDRTDP